MHLSLDQEIIQKVVLSFGKLISNLTHLSLLTNIHRFLVENIYALEFNMNISNKNLSSIYDRDNVCIFGVLKYKVRPDFCFIVANAHILFNNNRGDIKLGQSYQILKSMKILKEFYKTSKIIN